MARLGGGSVEELLPVGVRERTQPQLGTVGARTAPLDVREDAARRHVHRGYMAAVRVLPAAFETSFVQ